MAPRADRPGIDGSRPRGPVLAGACGARPGIGLCLLAALLGAGCRSAPVQSALHPESAPAARIAGLTWLLIAVCSAVFAVTMGLLLAALSRRARPEAPLGPTRFILLAGVLVPSLLLTWFLIASMQATVALKEPPAAALAVEIVGHQFWWEVRYPERNATIANELRIPVGQPVRLELTSADVIHSFWVPRLNGKMDLIPGHRNRFWIAADRPGTYRGQCAEYCGAQHAKMALMVVAMPPVEFRQWLERLGQPPAPPHTPLLRRGREAFFRAGCQQCHTIQGTPANGRIGPALSHLGSRLTLAAGTLPNTPANLQGWIANPQAIKPGNAMPRMFIPPDDLHALAAYLESLE